MKHVVRSFLLATASAAALAAASMGSAAAQTVVSGAVTNTAPITATGTPAFSLTNGSTLTNSGPVVGSPEAPAGVVDIAAPTAGASFVNEAGGSVRATGWGPAIRSDGTGTILTNVTGASLSATTDAITAGGTNTTISNGGTITGARSGISLEGAASATSITNTGAIQADDSVPSLTSGGAIVSKSIGATIIENSGTVSYSGRGGAIMQDAGGGNLTVNNSGSISGGGSDGQAISVFRRDGNGLAAGIVTITNTGTLSSPTNGAVEFDDVGTVTLTNQAMGKISSGALDAVLVGFEAATANVANASITNAGTISTTGTAGIRLNGTTTTIVNTGTIDANDITLSLQSGGAIAIENGNATITNSGTVTYAGRGGAIMQDSGSGNLMITNSGTIAGGGYDGQAISVFRRDGNGLAASQVTISNSGIIKSDAHEAIEFNDAASVSVTNGLGGKIQSTSGSGILIGFEGMNANIAAAAINNAGQISSATAAGLRVSADANTVGNAGTVSGATGILTGGATSSLSVTNSGTIIGASGAAVDHSASSGGLILTNSGALVGDVRAGTGSNAVTFTGGSLTGNVVGGGNTAVSFAAGSDTVSIAGSLNNVSQVSVASGAVSFAQTASTVGSFTQTGGSAILHGGSITAANGFSIDGGLFGGQGTLIGNVNVGPNGLLQVGASPDELHIAGNYSQTGGKILLEIDPDGHGGFLTDTLLFDLGNTISVDGAEIVFQFMDGADPLAFLASGKFDLRTFLLTTDGTATEALELSAIEDAIFDIASTDYNITAFRFDRDEGVLALAATAVPEPGTLSVLGLGLLGVGLVRRRRRARNLLKPLKKR